MQHLETEYDDDRDDGILLAEVNQSFWLLDGETHLDALVSNLTAYPKPVRYLKLQTMVELKDLLPEDLGISALWAVHPAVIDRLKQNNELTLVELVKTN